MADIFFKKVSLHFFNLLEMADVEMLQQLINTVQQLTEQNNQLLQTNNELVQQNARLIEEIRNLREQIANPPIVHPPNNPPEEHPIVHPPNNPAEEQQEEPIPLEDCRNEYPEDPQYRFEQQEVFNQEPYNEQQAVNEFREENFNQWRFRDFIRNIPVMAALFRQFRRERHDEGKIDEDQEEIPQNFQDWL